MPAGRQHPLHCVVTVIVGGRYLITCSSVLSLTSCVPRQSPIGHGETAIACPTKVRTGERVCFSANFVAKGQATSVRETTSRWDRSCRRYRPLPFDFFDLIRAFQRPP